MTIFHQLGDPVAGAGECLCQHHGAALAKITGTTPDGSQVADYVSIADNAVVVSTTIVTTERCCIVVNAATIAPSDLFHIHLEIERPLGTIRTTQEDLQITGSYNFLHHAAWEVLDPGTYIYYLVNRAGAAKKVYAALLKIIASDCEG